VVGREIRRSFLKRFAHVAQSCDLDQMTHVGLTDLERDNNPSEKYSIILIDHYTSPTVVHIIRSG
jgi:hypothetical protein